MPKGNLIYEENSLPSGRLLTYFKFMTNDLKDSNFCYASAVSMHKARAKETGQTFSILPHFRIETKVRFQTNARILCKHTYGVDPALFLVLKLVSTSPENSHTYYVEDWFTCMPKDIRARLLHLGYTVDQFAVI